MRNRVEFELPVWPRRPTAARVVLSLLCAGALGGLASPASGQERTTLTISVTDLEGTPLRGARVALSGPHAGGYTDASGEFVAHRIPAGALFITVSHLGYHPGVIRIRLEPGQPAFVGFRLEPDPIPLEGVQVETESGAGQLSFMRGFHERRDRGLGFFLTREDIERRGSTDLSNLLRTVPGLHVPPSQFGQARITTARGQPGSCRLQVYMDGAKYRHAGDLPGIPTSDIEAVEVYRGRSELPAEFADLEANCGVVVIWSRRAQGSVR